jgi:hypothetical protein
MTKISTVHQIELSTKCNLRCGYCPHPKLQREKTHMKMEVFEAALAWAKVLGGPELSLTGMGEAILHPQFCDMIRMARSALPATELLLSTNGIALDDEILSVLREVNATLYVSAHHAITAGKALDKAIKAGVRTGVNHNIVGSGFDWAGQVEWANLAMPHVCQYMSQGWATVLQNGDVVACCMDAHGLYPFGNVMDAEKPTHIGAIPLCARCHLLLPECCPLAGAQA